MATLLFDDKVCQMIEKLLSGLPNNLLHHFGEAEVQGADEEGDNDRDTDDNQCQPDRFLTRWPADFFHLRADFF